ncbi:IS1 family transposase [Escherichia coli]
MASVSISCPSCSATDGVVRNGKSGDAANLLI